MIPSLIKDLRTLAWPAAAILPATLLPVAWAASAGDGGALAGWAFRVAMVAFVLGTALLVALPFGAEFQQRTLVLLLSQPVKRGKVWIQKFGALVVVLLVLLLVQYLTLSGGAVAARVDKRLMTFVMLMACSGPLWTLVAGSTIGGAVFSLAMLLMVEMSASVSVGYVAGAEIDLFANHPAMVVVRAAYAGLTLWFGWRTFARYEVTGGGDGHSIGSLRTFEILRSRPSGARANLVRKELRLQQPTVIIAGVFIVCWLAALLFLALSPERPDVADVVLTVLLVGYVPLSLIVASAISVGEDTSLGIHAWHLTYPVSSAAQWSVKLGVTVGVAALLAMALPLGLVALAPLAVTLPAGGLQLPSPSAMALLSTSVLLTGFWTSTLARHTVRAAVMTGVALGVLAFAIAMGGWIGWRVGGAAPLLTSIMVQFQLPPESLHPVFYGLNFRRLEWLALGAALFLVVPLALRQSLAAFRTTRIDRRRIVRYSAQLGIVASLAAFIPAAAIRAGGDVYRSQPVRELELAVRQVAARSIAASADAPVSMSPEELEATGLLSDQTRRWLADTRISFQSRTYRDSAGQDVTYILTRVTFPNGRGSRMSYRLPDR